MVAENFDQFLGHWRSLKGQVDRHVDFWIGFPVLDQQELARCQSDTAVRQQILRWKGLRLHVLRLNQYLATLIRMRASDRVGLHYTQGSSNLETSAS